ncbi:hypothetical protein V1477_002538 [Vespula maculifrons]|uniref:Uncharacterized protein n=1 Tax=Vespula maculifrons TaxID=7453 RepID=A0ABD2CZL4_VESMC
MDRVRYTSGIDALRTVSPPPPPPYLTNSPTASPIATTFRFGSFLLSPGEDTRLYNYGVPLIGRSKPRFPASREEENAARVQRAALQEI